MAIGSRLKSLARLGRTGQHSARAAGDERIHAGRLTSHRRSVERARKEATHGRFEQKVVIALGVERRVKVDEVNGFIFDVLAEHLQMVAKEKLVHGTGE